MAFSGSKHSAGKASEGRELRDLAVAHLDWDARLSTPSRFPEDSPLVPLLRAVGAECGPVTPGSPLWGMGAWRRCTLDALASGKFDPNGRYTLGPALATKHYSGEEGQAGFWRDRLAGAEDAHFFVAAWDREMPDWLATLLGVGPGTPRRSLRALRLPVVARGVATVPPEVVAAKAFGFEYACFPGPAEVVWVLLPPIASDAASAAFAEAALGAGVAAGVAQFSRAALEDAGWTSAYFDF